MDNLLLFYSRGARLDETRPDQREKVVKCIDREREKKYCCIALLCMSKEGVSFESAIPHFA
jgi:hypothetical protein